MNYFIVTCAKQVLKNRSYAADKKSQYRTRLMYDRSAARWEQGLIDYANRLIANSQR